MTDHAQPWNYNPKSVVVQPKGKKFTAYLTDGMSNMWIGGGDTPEEARREARRTLIQIASEL